MILRRVISHFRKQEWTAIGLDFLIVVVGVYIGIALGNWNQARAAEARREQIVVALITDLRDAAGAQQGFVTRIQNGMVDWRAAFEAGELPPPFYLRIEGSDTAPKTWETLQQMQLTDMFDPATIFDLGFYYSELDGVGQRYIRYITFVETHVLPNLKRDPAVFYAVDQSALLPEYEANMDRMEDYGRESARLRAWADCLVYRLEAKRSFKQTCRRASYVLDGMPTTPEAAP